MCQFTSPAVGWLLVAVVACSKEGNHFVENFALKYVSMKNKDYEKDRMLTF
uniref:Uncharacterized protein n=1 Tax=Anguilla anguilla TaxID=7936 RepID=A0A0E9SBY5_ANGAN